MATGNVTIEDIYAARERIHAGIVRTPLMESITLAALWPEKFSASLKTSR